MGFNSQENPLKPLSQLFALIRTRSWEKDLSRHRYVDKMRLLRRRTTSGAGSNQSRSSGFCSFNGLATDPVYIWPMCSGTWNFYIDKHTWRRTPLALTVSAQCRSQQMQRNPKMYSSSLLGKQKRLRSRIIEKNLCASAKKTPTTLSVDCSTYSPFLFFLDWRNN